MPSLSILIPCLGETSQFENTLASVLQNRPEHCEILVAHNAPYDDPYKLGSEVCFIHVPEATTQVSLLNAGFEASRSAVVHVLQAGVQVPERWVESPLALFEDAETAVVSPVLVRAQSPQRILSAGWDFTAAGRCLLTAYGAKLSASEKIFSSDFLSPTLAAGFYRRSLWRHVRWDSSLCDQFAPLALAMAARELGQTCHIEPACVLSCEDQVLPKGTDCFGYEQAKSIERLYWRRENSASQRGSAMLHYGLLGVEFLAALPSPRAISGMFGRWAGMQGADAKAYQAKMADLRLKMEEQEASAATVPFVTNTQDRTGKAARPLRKAA